MKIKGAIFDLDGTLLDSMKIWHSVGEDYILSLGILPKENLAETFKDMSLEQSAAYYQSVYGVEKSTEEIIAGINAVIKEFYLEKALLKEGVKEFLSALHRNNVKMCITTAIDKYLAEEALIRCGVKEYFNKIFTCNKVGYGKDEPIIYERALQYLGTGKENTVVFEDAIHAIRTAKKAGFMIAGVFDCSEENQEEVQRLSDYYIYDFRDILTTIENQSQKHSIFP